MTEVEKLEIELDLIRRLMKYLTFDKELMAIYDDIQYEIKYAG